MAFPFLLRGFEQPGISHIKRLPDPDDQSAVVGVLGVRVGVHDESKSSCYALGHHDLKLEFRSPNSETNQNDQGRKIQNDLNARSW